MIVAARADHTNADCFVCCVLSHGDEGVIYGRDGTLKVDDLIAPFKPNALATTLAGKPKMFFIQVKSATPLNSATCSRVLIVYSSEHIYFLRVSVVFLLETVRVEYPEAIWNLCICIFFTLFFL